MANDEFDTWLSQPKKIINKCQTCKLGGKALEDIERYVKAAKAGRPVPDKLELFERIRTKYAYPLDYTSLIRHIRKCLGG